MVKKEIIEAEFSDEEPVEAVQKKRATKAKAKSTTATITSPSTTKSKSTVTKVSKANGKKRAIKADEVEVSEDENEIDKKALKKPRKNQTSNGDTNNSNKSKEPKQKQKQKQRQEENKHEEEDKEDELTEANDPQSRPTFPPSLMIRLLGQFAFKQRDTRMTAQALDTFTEYMRVFTTEAIWRSEQVMRQEEELGDNQGDPDIIQESHLQKVMSDISLDF